MKWKIGEIKQVNGEWYQCVVAMQEGCRECSFRTQDYCTRQSECMSTERSDKTSVVFKKLEKVGEPFERNGYMYQEYKAHTYPLLISGSAIIPTDNGFAVIIKQNKEDMEEKRLNLKPFDIQKAREGKPVCTRDGAKARIICFDAKSDAPIIALITTDDGTEIAFDYLSDGTFFNSENPDNNLMMLPEKKEGWMNIYSNGYNHKIGALIYNSKEEALNNKQSNAIDTVKIEWEE